MKSNMKNKIAQRINGSNNMILKNRKDWQTFRKINQMKENIQANKIKDSKETWII